MEPPGSQIPGHAAGNVFAGVYREHVGPRVGLYTMSRLGAESRQTMEAKLHGLYPNVHDFYRHSKISGRKRAFRRACSRAQRNCLGGTWYRGRWLRADAAVAGLPQRQAAPRVQSQVRRAASSAGTDEVRFISYNVGGSSTENYDVFGNWLQQQQLADVVIFQEVHWGLGKEDSSFQTGSRSVMTSIDSNNRFFGIAICVSKKLIDAADLRFSSVVPDVCAVVFALILLARINGPGTRNMFP